MHWFDNFDNRGFDFQDANGEAVHIHARVSRGLPDGRPALLLLHGFPQSHVLWNRVAEQLQQDYFLVMPDLRGYGDSSKAPGLSDHSNYSKRSMAADMVTVMDALGIDRFFLCGHDRGGRVSHRLALDHAARVRRLCVIDIAPTLDMYAGTNFEFARAYYHWFHLIQPSPVPENMISGNPVQYLHAKLGGWGSAGTRFFEEAAMAEYERCFCKPGTIHSMCEDYRASAGIDLEHDRESRAKGEMLACDMMVLWGQRGVVHRLFDPLTLWQAQCAGQVSGEALPSGHYIPEELPDETVRQLRAFFTS
jgi:haloacetate dehalogenase